MGGNPGAEVDELHSYAKSRQHAQGPEEYSKEMLAYDMVPEMVLDEVVRSENQDQQEHSSQDREEYVHPIFAEQADSFGNGFFSMFRPVAVLQQASREGSDEDGHSQEEQQTLDAEMSALVRVGLVIHAAVAAVDFVAVTAGHLFSAVRMVFLAAVAPVASVVDEVGDKSAGYAQTEEQQHNPQGLVREHCQHHEGLVSGRGNHHRHKGSETDQTVGIEGDDGKAAHTARYYSEQGARKHLARTAASESGEKVSVGFDVEALDHHHHYDDKSGDQNAIEQCFVKRVNNFHSAILSIRSQRG